MNAETLTALRELAQSIGSYTLLCVLAAYIASRLIDEGYELHLTQTKRRKSGEQ